VLETDNRHLGKTEPTRREDPSVARDDLISPVDQDRDVEPESFNALRDPGDLLLVVTARIIRIDPQLLDRTIVDRNATRPCG